MDERDWDAVAARFEEEIFNVPANDRKGLIKAAVRRHANSKGIAADIGCGVGRTIELLARHFGSVTASDISGDCLAIAQHRNRKVGNVTYHRHDLGQGPTPGPRADLALCINTLLLADHVKRARMFKHVCGSVRRGGHLLLVVPSIESVLLTHARYTEWRSRAKGRVPAPGSDSLSGREMLRGVVRIDGVATKHHSADELMSLLRPQGFRTLDMQRLEYPWTTEFTKPPRWMKAPFPWDWFVEAQRR